jgi:hypothetical protein
MEILLIIALLVIGIESLKRGTPINGVVKIGINILIFSITPVGWCILYAISIAYTFINRPRPALRSYLVNYTNK